MKLELISGDLNWYFTGKEIEASRLSDMLKDMFLNDSLGTWIQAF